MVPSNATSLASNPTCFTALIPSRTLKTQLNVSNISNTSSSTQQFFENSSFLSSSRTHLNFRSSLHKRCNILFVHARSKRRNNHTVLMDDSDFMEDEDEFDDFDDDEVEDEDEDDEPVGMFLPFGKMNEWLENKPSGFGEGKVYDTSIEDKLFEEMEQSRKAQALNIDNLKNNPVVSVPKTQPQKKKVIEDVVPGGIRVRVVNLPKKKNVHRDLNAAFKGVSGIVNVIPAVNGNKKTKDPICKGFGFVDFKSMEDAARFVQQFSRQSIPFGRVEKQIKCEILNSQSSNFSDDGSVGSFHSAPQFMASASGGESDNEFESDDLSSEETATDMISDLDSESIAADFEDITENVESFSISDIDGAERTARATGSFSSKKPNKKSKKRLAAKKSGVKVPKLDVPGSAKRLKIKEKSVLADVFTKYGSLSALVSSEGR